MAGSQLPPCSDCGDPDARTSLGDYAPVLGDDGLAAYRALAEERWADVPTLTPGDDPRPVHRPVPDPHDHGAARRRHRWAR